MSYEQKYLKYKNKYLELKNTINQKGGAFDTGFYIFFLPKLTEEQNDLINFFNEKQDIFYKENNCLFYFNSYEMTNSCSKSIYDFNSYNQFYYLKLKYINNNYDINNSCYDNYYYNTNKMFDDIISNELNNNFKITDKTIYNSNYIEMFSYSNKFTDNAITEVTNLLKLEKYKMCIDKTKIKNISEQLKKLNFEVFEVEKIILIHASGGEDLRVIKLLYYNQDALEEKIKKIKKKCEAISFTDKNYITAEKIVNVIFPGTYVFFLPHIPDPKNKTKYTHKFEYEYGNYDLVLETIGITENTTPGFKVTEKCNFILTKDITSPNLLERFKQFYFLKLDENKELKNCILYKSKKNKDEDEFTKIANEDEFNRFKTDIILNDKFITEINKLLSLNDKTMCIDKTKIKNISEQLKKLDFEVEQIIIIDASYNYKHEIEYKSTKSLYYKQEYLEHKLNNLYDYIYINCIYGNDLDLDLLKNLKLMPDEHGNITM